MTVMEYRMDETTYGFAWRLVCWVGGAASVALIALSMTINWGFGSTLGASMAGSAVYATMGVALDGVKLAMPFVLLHAWRNAHYVSCALAGTILAGCTVLSFTSAIGYAALNRSIIQDARTVMATSRQSQLTEFKRLREQLSATPDHRPLAIIISDLEAEKQHWRWTRTSGCTDATVKESIVFCARVKRLQNERTNSETASQLQRRIETLRKELASAEGKPLQEQDPQLSLLARLTALDVTRTRDLLIVILAMLLELGSSFGLFLCMQSYRSGQLSVENKPSEPALDQTRDPQNTCNSDDIEDFLKSNIEAEADARLDGSALYSAYTRWAHELGGMPLSQTSFGNWLRKHSQLKKTQIGGRVRYLGVRLKT